jgi:hypothetical protein
VYRPGVTTYRGLSILSTHLIKYICVFRKSISIYVLALARIYLCGSSQLSILVASTYKWLEPGISYTLLPRFGAALWKKGGA